MATVIYETDVIIVHTLITAKSLNGYLKLVAKGIFDYSVKQAAEYADLGS